jgi:hypothetical protein
MRPEGNAFTLNQTYLLVWAVREASITMVALQAALLNCRLP